jgi:hypothetical protein
MNKKNNQQKTELASWFHTAVPVLIEFGCEKCSAHNTINGTLEPISRLAYVSDDLGRIVKIMLKRAAGTKRIALVQVDDEMRKPITFRSRHVKARKPISNA